MVTIIPQEGDVDRLLRILYNGTRPHRVRLLICACGHSASLTDGDAAWLGWQILPHAKCPSCVAQQPYEGPEARERFIQLIDQLGKET